MTILFLYYNEHLSLENRLNQTTNNADIDLKMNINLHDDVL